MGWHGSKGSVGAGWCHCKATHYHIWKIMGWGPQCQVERQMSHLSSRKTQKRIFLSKNVASRTIPSIWYSWGCIWWTVSSLQEGVPQRTTRMIMGTWDGRKHWDNKVCWAAKANCRLPLPMEGLQMRQRQIILRLASGKAQEAMDSKGKLWLDIRKENFILKVIVHWNRNPERLWSPSPGRLSKLSWSRPCATSPNF